MTKNIFCSTNSIERTGNFITDLLNMVLKRQIRVYENFMAGIFEVVSILSISVIRFGSLSFSLCIVINK